MSDVSSSFSPSFTIWVDADACPLEAKDIIYRYAFNQHIPVVLVANRAQKLPKSKFVTQVVVAQGFDVADYHIEQQCQKDDIVITADIPLAAGVIAKGAHVITPAGSPLDGKNIAERLSVRNFYADLRSAGQYHGRSPVYDNKCKQAFAGALDRIVARLKKATSKVPPAS